MFSILKIQPTFQDQELDEDTKKRQKQQNTNLHILPREKAFYESFKLYVESFMPNYRYDVYF